MFSDIISTFKIKNNLLKHTVRYFDDTSHLPSQVDMIEWRRFTTSSILFRIYAIFEDSIEKMLFEFLDNLHTEYHYLDYSQKFKKNYRKKFSLLLQNLDYDRYAHIIEANIIKSYDEFLKGDNHTSFVKEAILRHDQNFKFDILSTYISSFGIDEFKGWVANNRTLASFYPEDNSRQQEISDSLKELVEYRNSAAHGSFDNIPGESELMSFTDTTEKILILLNEYLSYETIRLAPKAFNETFEITEIFSNNICVIKSKKNLTLNVDDEIYLFNDYNCVKAKINSMKIDNIEKQQFTSNYDGFEFGLKLSVKPFISYKGVKT